MKGYWIWKWFGLAALAWFSPMVAAATLEPFYGAQLQDEQRSAVTGYRLILSGTRTPGLSKELRLDGQVHRQVWAVDPSVPLSEVQAHYWRQLDEFDSLYQCKGLDCGSSQFWANELFRNARLVGREANQFYRVSMHTDAQGVNTLYVVYVIQRGTRQVMVNLDVLTTRDRIESGATLEESVRQSLTRSQGWVPGFVTRQGVLDVEASQPLLKVINQLSKAEQSRLHLMVHCYDSHQMQETLACSQKLATQLAQHLPLEADQIHAQGALSAPPRGMKPALRFVFWPRR